MAASDSLILGSRPLRLAELRRIYAGPVTVSIDPAAMRAVRDAHSVAVRLAAGETAVYGINTGFGLLAQTRIAPAQRALLQRNIILSHAAGVGALLDDAVVRLTLVLKLASLLQGFSGVSPELVRFLERLINGGLLPCVPAQGSVGASPRWRTCRCASSASAAFAVRARCSPRRRRSPSRASRRSCSARKRDWRC